MKEINPLSHPIEIKCQAAALLPLKELLDFQGNLKKLSSENKMKLVRSICSEGFIAPIFVWNDLEKYKILDGHGRLKALTWMESEGWDIPEIPVVYVDAANENEARRKLLKITSQYGEFDMEELNEWLDEFDESIKAELRLVDDELNIFMEQFEGSGDGSGEGTEEDDTYTGKIKAPIYEITGEKPEIKDMIDLDKSKELILEIQSANIEDKELENFLLRAAQRHTIFTYDKIAEYYAHSSPEIQDLMEKSALVIVDFKKAIEYGFLKLSADMAEAYEEELQGEELSDDEE